MFVLFGVLNFALDLLQFTAFTQPFQMRTPVYMRFVKPPFQLCMRLQVAELKLEPDLTSEALDKIAKKRLEEISQQEP